MKLNIFQKRKKFVLEVARKFHIRPDRRLKLYASFQRLYWKMHYPKDKYVFCVKHQSFTPSGSYYGHDYWLKEYSGFTDNIYAHIEHGVYFGDNRSIVADEEEWTLGNFITFGESRIELLNELYPNFNVFPIGPKIHYAKVDEKYLSELRSLLKPNTKTIVLFPAHSLAKDKYEYNADAFLDDAYKFAVEYGAENIFVSIHPNDYIHSIEMNYRDKKLITVSGGRDSIRFLPRLKAVLTVADVTYSNALGTHVGYSIYMGKPHVLNLNSNTSLDSLENRVYVRESKEFAKLFNEDNSKEITKSQYELCNHYFGLSKIKTPQELNRILIECKEKYEALYK